MRPSLGIGKFFALLLLVGLTGGGCEDCPRRLSTRATYTGTQTGVFYSREVAPGGIVVLFTSGPIDMMHSGSAGVATGNSCWEAPGTTDSGYLLEAWVDTDGDDEQPCRDDFRQTATCGPDPGEPQARMEFSIKAKGTTEVVLSFSDP